MEGETHCSVVGDGFTSIIDLQSGPDGTLYTTILSLVPGRADVVAVPFTHRGQTRWSFDQG